MRSNRCFLRLAVWEAASEADEAELESLRREVEEERLQRQEAAAAAGLRAETVRAEEELRLTARFAARWDLAEAAEAAHEAGRFFRLAEEASRSGAPGAEFYRGEVGHWLSLQRELEDRARARLAGEIPSPSVPQGIGGGW